MSPEDLKDFSKEKLGLFLLKKNRFVDRHRAITYKYLLDLPLNIQEYKKLVRKGLHSSTFYLRNKFPISNPKLYNTFEFVLSLLAHYC